MAVYDKIPEEKPARKTKRTGAVSRTRSQMPGHPTDAPRDLSESTTKNSTKETKPASNKLDGKDKPASNKLDGENNGKKVVGKGISRDTVAQGARKASTPSPKPKGNDKKVRG